MGDEDDREERRFWAHRFIELAVIGVMAVFVAGYWLGRKSIEN